MKKFFTFFMAVVVAFSAYAVTPMQLGKKADSTGHATELTNKKLAHHKQLAKVLGTDKLERKAMPKVPVTTKKAVQNEVVVLNYDAFAGMEYYEDEEQWWLGLSCDDMSRNEYGHNLSMQWEAPAENPCGKFTTEDFNYDYTHLTTPFSFGSIFFDEVEMTLSYEKISEHLERYTLTATMVDEEGITYQVNATHENIVPKAEVASVILDATLTQKDWNFTIEGKNNDLDLKLVVENTDIIGVYGLNMIDWENTKIAYKGASVSPLKFRAEVNLAKHIETGELAYVTEIKMLSKDTVDYHFVVAAPLPAPTDTIDLTAIDLTVDDSWAMAFGSVDFYASTPEFDIRGGWEASMATEGTFEAGIFLDTEEYTITSLSAEVTVTQDEHNNWAIEGTMLGDNNKIYNLHLSWSIPEQTDTVLVTFPTSGKASYYPYTEENENDLQISNQNDTFKASINVVNVPLGNDFDQEDILAYATSLEFLDGSPLSVAEIKNGKLYQVGDTTILEADFITFEAVLYQVKLWYVAPTPTETVKLDIENAELILDFEYSGAYNLIGYSADSLNMFVVTVPALDKEDIPGTFVNDGMFGKFGEGQYDFDASSSYVGKWNAMDMYYEFYYIQKGQFTVVLDDEDNITLTASVVCDDAIQYQVTLTSKYEEPHIEFDAEEGPVNRVYGADADVIINDYVEDMGLISMIIKDTTAGDVTALYFVVDEADAETILPEGTYPINDTWELGTVTASPGMEWDGSVIPSYYARYVDNWVVEPYYFFQEGSVVVTKTGKGAFTLEINALNSCGIPVHIVYGSPATGVEKINANAEGFNKQIIDGQLLIIREGKAYNAVGTQVK